MEKKVELLETLVIEMGNKIIKLETEINDIKRSKNIMITNSKSDYTIKNYEEIKDKNKGENKPDQGVKEPIVSENRKEDMIETEETPKLVTFCFKCDICGASFKKEVTLKKHINTKHGNQNCKVCNKVFKTSMEILEHVAKEHSENIVAIISVTDKEKLTEQQVDDISDFEDNIDKHIQFKCVKCKNIVPLHDKFNDDLKEDQMCKLCTMFAAYDD